MNFTLKFWKPKCLPDSLIAKPEICGMEQSQEANFGVVIQTTKNNYANEEKHHRS